MHYLLVGSPEQDYYSTNLVNYSISEYPKEACGLIVNISGKHYFRPCRNIAPDPTKDFIIDPIDQVRALKDAELLAIFHTHPVSSEEPSATDSLNCQKTQVPWVIYSVLNRRFFTLLPTEKKEKLPLMGREYVYGTYDCWNFICDVYSEELNIELIRPLEEDPYWFMHRNAFIDRAEEAGFKQVSDLKKYDVLLMTTQYNNYPNHSGIYYGDNILAHHALNRLSCREVYGGYWKKVTTHTFRHRSLL